MEAENNSPGTVRSEAESIKGPRTPYYLLSLEIENVRSFKDAQRLVLADAQGLPRRWTVLLGDNGLGKTTLLQVLASLQSRPLSTKLFPDRTTSMLLPRLFTDTPLITTASFLRKEADIMKCNAELSYGARLTDRDAPRHKVGLTMQFDASGAGSCGAISPARRVPLCATATAP
jgi:hypothetical protein